MSGFGVIFGQSSGVSTITDISAEGNGLTDGTVKFTAPPRAAMWILNRNADLSLADGIRYIAAVGGGLWIRDITLGSPGANFQDTWYVDFDNGDNTADGLTPATALASTDEVQARWGQQVIDGAITPVVIVNVAGNSSATHVFAPVMTNIALVYFVGTRTDTPGLSGTLTTYQNWNAATKTQCEFSWSSLPSTWTAGQFLALPSLGNVSVIAGKDVGSKTAVSCDAFDGDNWISVDGAAVGFQGYTFNSLTGKLKLSPAGNGVLVFQDIQLGNADAIDLHWLQIDGRDSAQVTFVGCRIYGVDTFNDNLAAAVGCYIVGWRNYGRDALQGTIHDSVGGAIYRVHENAFSDIWDHVLLFGIPSVDESGYLLVETDCSCYNAFAGWNVRGKMRIDGSFWVKNANASGWVLKTEVGGVICYSNASGIGSTGTPPTNLYVVPGATSGTLPLVATARLSGIVQL